VKTGTLRHIDFSSGARCARLAFRNTFSFYFPS
jgi:hypothetical protein